MNEFYVYRHTRLDTNTVFYVGKGKKDRAYARKTKRNIYWNRIVNLFGYKVEIVVKGLSESDALAVEFDLIKFYQSKNQCEANLREGGEMHGSFTQSSRDQISASLKAGYASGKFKHWRYVNPRYTPSPNKGKTRPKEIFLKSLATRGCRKFSVTDVKTNQIVWSGLMQAECNELFGLNKGHVNECLKGTRKSHKGYTFRYIEDITGAVTNGLPYKEFIMNFEEAA